MGRKVRIQGKRREGGRTEERVRGWEKWWSVGRGNEGGRRMGREEKEERRAGGDTRKRERGKKEREGKVGRGMREGRGN